MEKRDRIAALEEQLAEEEHIRERMAQLLAETAVALKGPEEARKRHGWQDLPEMVAALKIDLAAAQAERDALFRSKSTLNTRVLAAEAEVQALRVAHEAALKESVAKEREECAQTIGHCGGFDPHIRAQLVEAIRARSKP